MSVFFFFCLSITLLSVVVSLQGVCVCVCVCVGVLCGCAKRQGVIAKGVVAVVKKTDASRWVLSCCRLGGTRWSFDDVGMGIRRRLLINNNAVQKRVS